MFGESVEVQDRGGVDGNDCDFNADCGGNVHGAVNERFVQSERCRIVHVSPVRNG